MEEKILNIFLYNNRLKFSEIEKSLSERSNKLTYHLKNMIKKGLLKKEEDSYFLAEKTENSVPYISDKKAVIPVVLIAIKNRQNKVFLHKREKKPFKEKLSLPGGRILIGENIKNAAVRIMKEKFNVICKFEKINSISLEQVRRNGKTVHSFLLIFVTATTKQDLEYYGLKSGKSKIIPSDYKLIKNNLNKKTSIENLVTFS